MPRSSRSLPTVTHSRASKLLGTTVDDMLDDWSSSDRAWRQLAGIALRAREAEARIALVVQQSLEAIQGDRERVLNGLARRGDQEPSDEVVRWGREVLADLDRVWGWAGDFASNAATTAAVPAWVAEALSAGGPRVKPAMANENGSMSRP